MADGIWLMAENEEPTANATKQEQMAYSQMKEREELMAYSEWSEGAVFLLPAAIGYMLLVVLAISYKP